VKASLSETPAPQREQTSTGPWSPLDVALSGEPQQKQGEPGPSRLTHAAKVLACLSTGAFVACLTKTSSHSVITRRTLLLWSDRRPKGSVKFRRTAARRAGRPLLQISLESYAQCSRAWRWRWRQVRSPRMQFLRTCATCRLIAFQRPICQASSSGSRRPM
jgi:hypothetical protein